MRDPCLLYKKILGSVRLLIPESLWSLYVPTICRSLGLALRTGRTLSGAPIRASTSAGMMKATELVRMLFPRLRRAYASCLSAASSRGNAASISGSPTAPTLNRNHPVSSTEPKAWNGTTAIPADSST